MKNVRLDMDKHMDGMSTRDRNEKLEGTLEIFWRFPGRGRCRRIVRAISRACASGIALGEQLRVLGKGRIAPMSRRRTKCIVGIAGVEANRRRPKSSSICI